MRRRGILPMVLLLCACVQRPAPDAAVMSEAPAPWEAPRDAVSWIDAAGLPQQPLDTQDDPWILTITVTANDEAVTVPAHVGVDRLRAVQAPVHTHDTSGEVWLEGEGNREVTLGQFFTVWGVRFTDGCLGSYCSDLRVTADGALVADPASLVLRGHDEIAVTVRD